MQVSKCTLCSYETLPFFRIGGRAYLRCTRCSAVLMNPSCHPGPDEERERYLKHRNDVDDPGYRAFVSPIVDAVSKEQDKDVPGLDFGCGNVPIVSMMLRERGYRVESYDPFFMDDRDLLNGTYRYIAACEVIEHFHHPFEEFRLLRSLLRDGGSLYCKTSLFSESIDFSSWYYKDDPTHVFFYAPDTLDVIAAMFDLSSVEVEDGLIKFRT